MICVRSFIWTSTSSEEGSSSYDSRYSISPFVMVAGADYYCLSEANKADSKASRDSELDSKSTSKAERAICSKFIYIFN